MIILTRFLPCWPSQWRLRLCWDLTLKFEGVQGFILQTKTDGPVNMLVADFVSPNGIRGVARMNRQAVEDAGRSGNRDRIDGRGLPRHDS